MKRTTSLPDNVAQAAAKIAAELGLSLDELLVVALDNYLSAYCGPLVKELLDAIYADEPSVLDPAWRRAQAALLRREDW